MQNYAVHHWCKIKTRHQRSLVATSAPQKKTLRPISLVAQQSGQSASIAHEAHGDAFARFQTLEIQTGSSMVDQHRPQYLGFANPFTMPVAVGGYDMLAADGSRWRRPTNDDMNSPGSQVPMKDGYFRNIRQVASALVQCADLARGMARRCEAQYRRHWQFLPGLWNLYFREKVNTGPSLFFSHVAPADCKSVDQG